MLEVRTNHIEQEPSVQRTVKKPNVNRLGSRSHVVVLHKRAAKSLSSITAEGMKMWTHTDYFSKDWLRISYGSSRFGRLVRRSAKKQRGDEASISSRYLQSHL